MKPIVIRGRKVELAPVAKLIPYARNARKHDPEQVDVIVASIREFGWTQPVLVNAKGGIIAGHGRVLAAQKLGMDEVPIIVLAGLTKAQERALILADNQTALRSSWDDGLLRIELEALKADGFEIGVIGFDEASLAAIFNPGNAGETDPDDVPEPPKNPVSRLGDIWIMGDHRLICGDSTSADVVGQLLRGEKPHLMATDPPYGVEYDADWRNHAMRANGSAVGGRAVGKVENDDKADWREAWALFPGDVAYVWHGALHGREVAESLEYSGFNIRSQIIWTKQQMVIGRGDYHWMHEPCWYVVRKGKKGHWSGDRKQTTLWQIDKPRKSETGHSTQKPVECMKRPIENNSKPGDAVYEPFSGSGTTIIAAEMTGRHCYAIELSPAYTDVAVQRWEAFTGRTATLESSGQTFAAVMAQRVKKKGGSKGRPVRSEIAPASV